MGQASSEDKRAAWEKAATVKSVLVYASIAELRKTIGSLHRLPARSVELAAEMAYHKADLWMWSVEIVQGSKPVIVTLVMGVAPTYQPVLLAWTHGKAAGARDLIYQQQCRVQGHVGEAHWHLVDRSVALERLRPRDFFTPPHSPLNPLLFCRNETSVDLNYRWMRGYRDPYHEPKSMYISGDFLPLHRPVMFLFFF